MKSLETNYSPNDGHWRAEDVGWIDFSEFNSETATRGLSDAIHDPTCRRKLSSRMSNV